MSLGRGHNFGTYKTVTSDQVFSTRSMPPGSQIGQVSSVGPGQVVSSLGHGQVVSSLGHGQMVSSLGHGQVVSSLGHGQVVSSVGEVSNMSPMQMSSVSQMTSVPVAAMNGSYESMRYMVPMQQSMAQQPYVLVQQPMVQQRVIQQAVMQPMVQQRMVYMQTLPRVSAVSTSNSSLESEMILQHQENYNNESDIQSPHSVFSQSPSPIKSIPSSPELKLEETVELQYEEGRHTEAVEVQETEIINIIEQKTTQQRQRSSVSEQREVIEPTKLDTRFFGELLADVHRRNCDIHSYILENVSKIRGQKHSRDLTSDLKGEKLEVESLIPKGASELTKQQMRYLLLTRCTAEKNMRLLLSTFSDLREELMQMSEDMRRLESEKESLERDLNFKADQARQYDSLIEGIRDNNRQLQVSLKESTSKLRSLETLLTSSQNNDSAGSFRIKELEGRMRALEKENEILKHKDNGSFRIKELEGKIQMLQNENDSLKQNDNGSFMIKDLEGKMRVLQSENNMLQHMDNGSFRIKDLEGKMRVLQNENDMLQQKLAGQANNDNLHLKTEALAQHYNEQLQTLKTERDMEIEKLRYQISKLQTHITTMTTTTSTKSSSDTTLQLKISELLNKLEQREKVIIEKEKEIRKLMMERNESSQNVTRTVITNRYKNQYPLLGLLSDDYRVTSPVKESKTILIERTGERISQE